MFRILLVICLFSTGSVGKSINHAEAVTIGGIKQWMKWEGIDDQAPVLLFLHGGPGNSVMAYADKFTNQLKQHFVVVHWDQRQSGKTATLNESPVSVDLIVRDAVEVVHYLAGHFTQDKIYVMGHSWGGYLALRVAAEIPQRLVACIAISPMIHQLESETLSLSLMKAEAAQLKNVESLNELNQVTIPFRNTTQLYYHRKWLSNLMGTNPPSRHRVEQWATLWLPVFLEASQTNFFEFAPALACRLFFLVGRLDYQTHYKLTESYYQQVVCPEKKLYWFEQSAHNPHLTETMKFEQTVIDIKNQIN